MMRFSIQSGVLAIGAAALILSGCAGVPVPGETEAQRRADAVGAKLAELPPLPGPAETGSLSAYMRYALWRHPGVEAACEQWRASAADITAARSLPDPRLTLQFDFASELTSLMPGLSTAYTSRGKREAQGGVALAASNVAYREYVSALLSTGAALQEAWIELAYVDALIQRQEELAGVYDSAARASRNDYISSTNGDLSRIAELERRAAKARADLEILEERRDAARAAFKSAMGLRRSDPDPLWPSARLEESAVPDEELLWKRIVSGNPELATLRAAVDGAVAAVAVAEQARTPDFSAGLMSDVKMDPVMYRPQAGVSLPVWKDKIREGIAAANARLDASRAAGDAREIALAARFADLLYRVRASGRTIRYMDEVALPSLRTVENFAGAGFQAGNGSASAPQMAQAARLELEIERLGQMRNRERAVTELELLSAGIAPESAPLLGEQAERRASAD